MARRLSERVLDHNGRDAKSHLIKHAIEKCNKYSKREDFNIIDKSYRNNTLKRKVTESLSMTDVWPILNTHEKSVSLKLFNWYPVCLFHYLVNRICKDVCGGVSFEVICFTISLKRNSFEDVFARNYAHKLYFNL